MKKIFSKILFLAKSSRGKAPGCGGSFCKIYEVLLLKAGWLEVRYV